MIFKDTMSLREDDGTMREVPCTLFDYKTNVGIIKCGIHTSIQPWSDGNCDVSEVTTGRRMCELSCNVKGASIKIASSAVDKFVEDRGIRNIFARIKFLKKVK